jgi:hypothetical protein
MKERVLVDEHPVASGLVDDFRPKHTPILCLGVAHVVSSATQRADPIEGTWTWPDFPLATPPARGVLTDPSWLQRPGDCG